MAVCTHLGCIPIFGVGNLKDFSVHVMDHIMMHQEEQERSCSIKFSYSKYHFEDDIILIGK